MTKFQILASPRLLHTPVRHRFGLCPFERRFVLLPILLPVLLLVLLLGCLTFSAKSPLQSCVSLSPGLFLISRSFCVLTLRFSSRPTRRNVIVAKNLLILPDNSNATPPFFPDHPPTGLRHDSCHTLCHALRHELRHELYHKLCHDLCHNLRPVSQAMSRPVPRPTTHATSYVTSCVTSRTSFRRLTSPGPSGFSSNKQPWNILAHMFAYVCFCSLALSSLFLVFLSRSVLPAIAG